MAMNHAKVNLFLTAFVVVLTIIICVKLGFSLMNHSSTQELVRLNMEKIDRNNDLIKELQVIRSKASSVEESKTEILKPIYYENNQK